MAKSLAHLPKRALFTGVGQGKAKARRLSIGFFSSGNRENSNASRLLFNQLIRVKTVDQSIRREPVRSLVLGCSNDVGQFS